MTKKEFDRLKIFLKEHSDRMLDFHCYIILYNNRFVNPFNYLPKIDGCLFDCYHFKDIQKVNLWISNGLSDRNEHTVSTF